MRQTIAAFLLTIVTLCPMKNEALTLQQHQRRRQPLQPSSSTLFPPPAISQPIRSPLFFQQKMTSSSSTTTTTTTQSSSASPYYTAPSIFTPKDSRPIVLFDGNCNLCSWAVQLILDNDRANTDPRGNLRVAALQSRVGLLLLDRMPPHIRSSVLNSSSSSTNKKEEEEYKSIVVCSKNKTYTNSNAVLRIGRALRFPFFPLARLAYLVPRFIRDFVYGIVSRNRKKWFGTRAECRLWDDNWDMRFVDDVVLGGEGSGGSNDFFADPNAPKEEVAVKEEEESVAVEVGERVRVVSEQPIVLSDVEGHPEGLCVSGCVGTVMKHPENGGGCDGMILVEFDEKELLGGGGEEEETQTTGLSVTFQANIAKGNFVKV